MNKSWLFLFTLLIPYLTSCAQVEVSLSGDNAAIVDVPPYRFNPEDVLAATPLCPFTSLASYKQNTGVWCWAASAQMVINYLGNPISQCYIASITLQHTIPSDPPGCCMAEDSFVPDPNPPDPPGKILYDQWVEDARTKCLVRYSPLEALRKNGYTADTSGPLGWEDLTGQLCGQQKPYVSVVRFYDDNGSLAGAHSSVVGGGRVTPNGDKYVEVSDHSEDDFFLMKWEAFKTGVPGDFVHAYDYINIKQLP